MKSYQQYRTFNTICLVVSLYLLERKRESFTARARLIIRFLSKEFRVKFSCFLQKKHTITTA